MKRISLVAFNVFIIDKAFLDSLRTLTYSSMFYGMLRTDILLKRKLR